jgi:hypothetical protein
MKIQIPFRQGWIQVPGKKIAGVTLIGLFLIENKIAELRPAIHVRLPWSLHQRCVGQRSRFETLLAQRPTSRQHDKTSSPDWDRPSHTPIPSLASAAVLRTSKLPRSK